MRAVGLNAREFKSKARVIEFKARAFELKARASEAKDRAFGLKARPFESKARAFGLRARVLEPNFRSSAPEVLAFRSRYFGAYLRFTGTKSDQGVPLLTCGDCEYTTCRAVPVE